MKQKIKAKRHYTYEYISKVKGQGRQYRHTADLDLGPGYNPTHYDLFYILYTLAVSPSLGGSRQHKRNNKTMGISLRSSSNDEGPSRVWMALLEQHSPSSPVFHNLRRFIYAISTTAPTTGLTL